MNKWHIKKHNEIRRIIEECMGGTPDITKDAADRILKLMQEEIKEAVSECDKFYITGSIDQVFTPVRLDLSMVLEKRGIK
jgi:hypothetical protein